MIPPEQPDPVGDAVVDDLLGRLTLEQKVGQCFTYLFSGHLVEPSVVGAIERLHCGALRLQPFCLAGKRLKYYDFDSSGAGYPWPEGYEPVPEKLFSGGPLADPDPATYAATLNRLQEIAIDRPGGIPLSFSIDQEGDVSRDYHCGGIALFPAAMGVAATNDPGLAYRVGHAVGAQLSAMGITTIHSPVVDVNLAPDNPEIGIRAFGDDPETVTRYALATMRGLQAGGLSTTAKHFPGRGDSAVDAHHDVPLIAADRARLDAVELAPYRALIADGLDSVMLAHTVYPALDPENLATVSRRIVTGLLREELGFRGVITTDAIAMGALVERHSLPTACALALAAGADMVLNKMETPFRDQGFLETLAFVRDGRISETELDAKVRRILRMKYRRGLFGRPTVDPAAATAEVGRGRYHRLARTVARRCCLVLHDRGGALPLSPDEALLVIEQQLGAQNIPNTPEHHRLSFSEAVLGRHGSAIAADTAFTATEEDLAVVLPLAERVQTVLMTNHYARGNRGSNGALAARLAAAGKRVVLVTNSPYPETAVAGAAASICCFATNPDSYRAAVDIAFGRARAGGRWPLTGYRSA